MGTQSKKRKRALEQCDSTIPSKKPTPTRQPQSSAPASPPSNPPLATVTTSRKATRPRPTSISPHASILSTLEPKYSVLTPSVLPVTKIRTRITQILAHLLPDEDGADKGKGIGRDLGTQTEKDEQEKRAVVLLHARAGSVCKMITITEQVKRLVAAEGKTWWQYNEMFEPAPKEKEKEDAGGGDGGAAQEGYADDDDNFEIMQPVTIFEKAIIPQKEELKERSLRVFLSTSPVPELKARPSVTAQTNAE